MGKKYLIGIILITLVLLLVGIFYADGVSSLKLAIENLEPRYVFLILGLMFAYWLSQAIIIMQLAHNQGQATSLYAAFKTYMIGEFFSAVTPFSSGGQPMQVFYMSGIGIPTGVSTSILGVQLFFYTVARLLITFALSIYHGDFFYARGYAFTYMLVLGLIVGVAMVVFMVLAAYKPEFVKKIVLGFYKFLLKIKILKPKDEFVEKIEGEIENFNLGLQTFRGQSLVFYIMMIVENVIGYLIFYAMTYYIFVSYGVRPPSVSLTFAICAAVQISSGYIPIPGASLGAEGMFYLMFSSILPEGAPIFLVLLTWRLTTYYVKILLTFPFTIKLKEEKQLKNNKL